MSYNAKNYTEPGGEVTHIGGKLIIEEGAEVEGFEGGGSYTLPTASADTLGGVKAKAKDTESVAVAVDGDGKLYVPAYPQAESVANCAAEDTSGCVTSINAIISALKTAGIMKNE